MIEKLPGYYSKSKVLFDLYDVLKKAFDKVETDISVEDLKLFITTTTEFDLHEKDVGLTPVIADIETRRSRILARLQGNALLTKSELESLICIYEKTGCTIVEDAENYTVIITFSGRKGKPHNMDELRYAIEEVKPAHIQIEYIFLENTWTEADGLFGIWDNVSDTMTWEEFMHYDERIWIFIDGNNIPYLQQENANAYLVFREGVPYAQRL